MQILENLSHKFNTLHGEINRAHLSFHPAQMVCSQREWYLEGFQCSASFGAELPVEWLKRRRRVCNAPLLYTAPEMVAAEHNEVPLVVCGALDCWAVGVTVFQLFFRKEAEQAVPIDDDKVCYIPGCLFACRISTVGLYYCSLLLAKIL